VPKGNDPFFTVLGVGRRPPDSISRAFLLTDNWDDWFRYSTQYFLVVFDQDGKRHEVGSVKIGQFEMGPDQRRADIPKAFDLLSSQFFSVGQDDTYYEALNALGAQFRDRVLRGLRDMAADNEIFDRALREDVTSVSLFRSVRAFTVKGQFRRLARGEARLTPFNFAYRARRVKGSDSPPVVLSFEVTPDSSPPTNIHVVIGRNGVGKTYLLNQMSRAIVDTEAPSGTHGRFVLDEETHTDEAFANLVSVTFSAFDQFVPLPEPRDSLGSVRYSYIGLQRPKTKDAKARVPKSPAILAEEFVRSMQLCRKSGKTARWSRALETLEADPLFRQAELTSLATERMSEDWEQRTKTFFRKLSSGHKVVLLTITRLVETVDERTLILLDEPEAHLHPPLLAAFVRALSDLLVQQNGVAIVATHSPVLLQEVPRTCVWKLRRVGGEMRAERPETETFGENVGVLSREVFGLEISEAGFHRLLKELVDRDLSFQQIRSHFSGQLGAEALALVRSMVAARRTVNGETDA
jgi:predicted ATPase